MSLNLQSFGFILHTWDDQSNKLSRACRPPSYAIKICAFSFGQKLEVAGREPPLFVRHCTGSYKRCRRGVTESNEGGDGFRSDATSATLGGFALRIYSRDYQHTTGRYRAVECVGGERRSPGSGRDCSRRPGSGSHDCLAARSALSPEALSARCERDGFGALAMTPRGHTLGGLSPG
jgi:hypothetical protein